MVGSFRKIASLSGGDFFGETALIADFPRTAAVITDTETELFVIYKKDFRKILMNNPKISEIIMGVFSKRRISSR